MIFMFCSRFSPDLFAERAFLPGDPKTFSRSFSFSEMVLLFLVVEAGEVSPFSHQRNLLAGFLLISFFSLFQLSLILIRSFPIAIGRKGTGPFFLQ